MSEVDYCPLTGDQPNGDVYLYRRTKHDILIPARYLPAGTTDAQAEHERALMMCDKWTRHEDGTVTIYGVM